MKRKIVKRTTLKTRRRRTTKTRATSVVKLALRKNPKKALVRQRIKRARPVHKRILLHPLSILMLLCVGVLIAGWTIRTVADSLAVTLTVDAPAPTQAATITAPVDQQHFTAAPVTVSGVCLPNTYVELYQNGNFSGAVNCGAGVDTYQIVTDLSPGANNLYTNIFSITNDEGPQSAHITVFYDLPPPIPPPAPIVAPQSIAVTSQDNTTYYAGNVVTVSPYPTITGTAPPNSKVILTFHSNPETCITYADSSGVWSCMLDQPLTQGIHTVSITAITPSGQVLYFTTYTIRVSNSLKPLQQIGSTPKPFLIVSSYQYQVYDYGQDVGLTLSLSGGASPYAVSIDWGDGNQTAVLRTSQSQFTATHAYKPLGTPLKDYVIKIQAVDNNGTKAFLQTTAAVWGRQPGTLATLCNPSIAQANHTSCTPPSLLSKMKQWIWVVWPTYAVVVLMVFSFWLGERRELLLILSKKRLKQHYHR